MRDHCHYTGKYQGPAHSICNLRYKIPHYIPIVFHNLSRYDAPLFIREMGKKFDTGKIGVIAENKEKYSSFNIDVVVESYTDDSGEVKEKKTWSCCWLDQFLTLALDAWILSKFSTLYWICLLLVLLILVGVELPLCL